MTTSVEEAQRRGWVADDSSFGARLALVRQRMGWGNVKEAAVACGLPAESWRRWERGGVEPRRIITIAMTIATRTGCDYLWLVHGPLRGGLMPTREYFGGTRVIASIEPNRTTGALPSRTTQTGRAVRQTRPLAGQAVRPRTPVAV